MDISWTIPSIIFGSAIMKILIRAVSRLNLEVRSIMGNDIYTFETNPTIYDIRISNKSISNAYELPETGGPGTTILYIGALLIMISAAIILYKNQKRKE